MSYNDVHGINVQLATEIGLEESIILGNIKHWVSNNAANNKNLHDGEYWYYNSSRAFQETYPYISQSKIYNVLKRLEKDGYIKTGTFNKAAYDRTKWYTLTAKGWELFGICEVPFCNLENDILQNKEPIPIIDNNIDTISKPKKKKINKKEKDEACRNLIREYTVGNNILFNALIDWYEERLEKAKDGLSTRLIKRNLNDLTKHSGGDQDIAVQIVDRTIARGWLGFFPLDNKRTNSKPEKTYGLNEQELEELAADFRAAGVDFE